MRNDHSQSVLQDCKTFEHSTRIGTIGNPKQLAALALVMGLVQRDPETAILLLERFLASVTPTGFWSALEEASGEKLSSLLERLAQESADDFLGEGLIVASNARMELVR